MTDDDEVHDGEVHDEDDGGDDGRLPGPAAAYAINWRTVLAVDALVGVAVLVAGVVLAVVWNPVGGGFIGSLGAVYVVLVGRRARQFAQLRRDAGL